MLRQCLSFPSHKSDHGPGIPVGVGKRGTTETSGQWEYHKRYNWRSPCPDLLRTNHTIPSLGYSAIGGKTMFLLLVFKFMA